MSKIVGLMVVELGFNIFLKTGVVGNSSSVPVAVENG